jgi:rhodanese-related sulfurtransferase
MKYRVFLRVWITVIMATGLFQMNGLYASDTTGKSVDEHQFAAKMKKHRTVVLDVRTPDEYRQGHLKDAINFNVMDSVQFMKQIQSLKKGKKYLLYCKSGKRSGKALMIMQDQGFKKVLHLQGGITAWHGEIETTEE